MKNKKTPLWIYLLSLLLGLTFVQRQYDTLNINLSNFADRTIGIAVLQGIDINLRSMFYIKSVIYLILINLVSIYILKAIYSYIRKNVKNKDLLINNSALLTLTSMSIFYLLYRHLNTSTLSLGIQASINIILTLYLIIVVTKTYFSKRDKIFYQLLNDHNFAIFSFLFPLVIIFTRWVFIKGSFVINKSLIEPYYVLWFIYWISLRLLFKILPIKSHSTKKVSILKAFSISSLIPFSIPLSNELTYILSKNYQLNTNTTPIIGIILLLTVASVVFLTNKNNKSNFNYKNLIFLPVFVITATLYNQYIDIIRMDGFDTFHHGENLLSAQQLFQFGKIPFTDVYPTHGMSYLLSQILYSIFNGYSSYTPWLWEWIPKLIEISLLYIVLSKITDNFFAAISIVFLPFLGIFGGASYMYGYNRTLPYTYYFVPLLIGICLAKLNSNLNRKNLTILWILNLFVMFWRIDFGIASTLVSMFITLLLLIKQYITKRKLPNYKLEIIKPIFVTLLIGTSILFTLSGFNSKLFTESIINILMFIKFQPQAQGLLKMADPYSVTSFVQYIIFPLIGIIFGLYFIYLSFDKKQKNIPNHKVIIAFIAFFSLVVSTRSLQRQTLSVAGFNPYFFLFLVFISPIYFSSKKRGLHKIYYVMFVLIYQILKPIPTTLAKNGQLISLHKRQSRVNVNESQFSNLVNYLNNNLKENQTFIDMTSSPILYVASNKEFINYLIPNAYWTSETIQKSSLERFTKAYDENKIPIVIMKQPVLAANSIDQVPNEIRSYRIYEFIYQHYQPFKIIDGYEIWTTPNKDVDFIMSDIAQNFDLGYLPYYWNNFDSLESSKKTNIIDEISLEDNTLNKNQEKTIYWDNNFEGSKVGYLQFLVTSPKKSKITISYGSNLKNSFTFYTKPLPFSQGYIIRMTTQFDWFINEIKSVTISSSEDIVIDSILLKSGD